MYKFFLNYIYILIEKNLLPNSVSNFWAFSSPSQTFVHICTLFTLYNARQSVANNYDYHHNYYSNCTYILELYTNDFWSRRLCIYTPHGSKQKLFFITRNVNKVNDCQNISEIFDLVRLLYLISRLFTFNTTFIITRMFAVKWEKKINLCSRTRHTERT